MAGSSWTNQVLNQLIIAGAIPGLLTYNPAIAANDLIASISGTTTTDRLGNVVLGGITSYSKGAGAYIATTLGGPGGAGGLKVQKATTEAGPYSALSDVTMDQSGDILIDAAANILLSCGGGVTGPGQLQAQTPGVLGFLPVMQVDISTHAVGNTITAGDITKTWAISTGDGNTGTTYTIKALAQMSSGNTATETLTIGIDADGVQTPLATLGQTFNGSALSTSYDIPLELTVIVDGAGAGAPLVYLSGPLGDISANRLSVNSANMSGHSGALSWTGSASHTLAIYAQWGGTGGTGQNIQTIASRLYREGP